MTTHASSEADLASVKRDRILRRWRWTSRIAVMVVSVILLYLPVHTVGWSLLVPACSPLVSAAFVLATHTVSLAVVPAVVVVLLAAWQKRWFCHWACPTGCCADGASWLGRKAGLRLPRIPVLNTPLALLILAGACFGYPVLLWTDPLALWSNAIGVGLVPSGWTAWVGSAAFGGVFILSLLWPHGWCTRVCPLGSMQDWIAQGTTTFVHWTANANTRAPLAAESTKENRGRRSQGGVPRRALIGGALGAAWGWSRMVAHHPIQKPLRPPGAAGEESFTSLCIRCGNCLRACPTDVISVADLAQGLAGWLSPVISFAASYCLESCNRCTTVCPSGALTFVPVEQKLRAVIGVPRVDMNVCLLGDDRDCRVCRNRCPFEAIRLEFDEEEYTLVPRIDMHRCPGCGACEVACPTTPRKAITIQPIAG